MKELISKELIENVLNCEIEDFKMFGCDLMYYEKALFRVNCQGQASKDRDSICRAINIYEFAFKCKEWALDKGYTIESHTNRSFISKYNREYFSVAKIFKETDSMRINTIDESTEIEAIIKACNWILEQNK